MPIFFLQAWAYIKKYWYIIAAIVGFIVALIVFRKQQVDIAQVLADIEKRHKEELDEIQKARDLNDAQHRLNEEKMQKALDAIQKQYEEAQKELTDEKKAEIKQIVSETKDDPNELARRLSEATGFTVILPTEE